LIRVVQFLCALCFLAALGLVCTLALAPSGSDFGMFAKIDDKVGHFIAFFLLCLFAYVAFPRLSLAWIFAILLIMGAAIEFGQTFTGRETSLEDFAANVLGLMAGALPLAAYRLRQMLNSRTRSKPAA